MYNDNIKIKKAKMTENKFRNSNIELLRFILMFFIFLWHILVHAYEIKSGPYSSVQATHIQLIMCSIFVPSVNCFMLISGYYGINFTKDKATSFILQVFFIPMDYYYSKY